MDLSKYKFSDFVLRSIELFGFEDEHMIEKKHWGAAIRICDSAFGQMSLAIIDKGGFCSRHFHNQKVNVFSVISGTLQIKTWNDSETEDIVTRKADNSFAIEAGMSWQIPVNQIHMMEANVTDVLVMESYFSTAPGHRVFLNDIHRLTIGGKYDLRR